MFADRVKVHFPLLQDEDGYPPVAVESMWARPDVGRDTYVIDSIPFFARDVALGDIVTVRSDEGGNLWFDQTARRSGNSLVRIVFFDPTCVDRIRHRLRSIGCSTEYDGAHKLLAVNVPDGEKLRATQAYLKDEASQGCLDYEEPILATL